MLRSELGLFETPSVADLALAVVEQLAEQAGEAKLNEILTEVETTPQMESSARANTLKGATQ